MTLYEKIVDAITNDDESPDDISDKLLDLYNKSSNNDKHLIDEVFCILTGWNLKTLI